MKQNLIPFLLLIVITLCGNHAFAQVVHQNKNDSLVVFSSEEEQIKNDTAPTLKSVIHFGWLQPARGRFPLFYEHALGANFGLSAGLGITYVDFFRPEQSSILFDPSLGENKIGLHTEGILKWYLSGFAIEDIYIGFNYKFSTFNYTKFEQNLTNEIQELHHEYVIIAGTQFNEWGNKLVYDYYFGVGMSQLYTQEESVVNIGGIQQKLNSTNARGINPIIRIGVKMGIKLN